MSKALFDKFIGKKIGKADSVLVNAVKPYGYHSIDLHVGEKIVVKGESSTQCIASNEVHVLNNDDTVTSYPRPVNLDSFRTTLFAVRLAAFTPYSLAVCEYLSKQQVGCDEFGQISVETGDYTIKNLDENSVEVYRDCEFAFRVKPTADLQLAMSIFEAGYYLASTHAAQDSAGASI